MSSRLSSAWAVSIIAKRTIVASACCGVVGAAVEQRALRAEAARAARRIAGAGDEALGLGAGADHRADDAIGAGVQRLHDDAGLEPRHAHQRHGGGGRDRGHHLDRGGVVDNAVLQVDRQRVPALVRHRLGGEATGDRQPAVDGGTPFGPEGSQRVGSHRRLSFGPKGRVESMGQRPTILQAGAGGRRPLKSRRAASIVGRIRRFRGRRGALRAQPVQLSVTRNGSTDGRG